MLPPSTRLGPYELIAPIGAGGMGEVHRARDTRLGRDVAIKVLPKAFINDPERLARFEREAKAVASLSHPNILTLYDFGTDNGIPYAVTELLEGETLRERISREAMTWQIVVKIAVEISSGLAEAHSKSIIHRDLKPDNIFLTSDKRVKILDFGLAKVADVPSPDTATTFVNPPSPTRTGEVLGTVPYMSPEQLRGQPVDARCDVFAFGVILYEMLARRRPFTGNSDAELMAAILLGQPAALGDSQNPVPVELQRLIFRCLEKNRAARFQSVDEIKDILNSLLLADQSETISTVPRRNIRRVGIPAVTLMLILAVSTFVFRHHPDVSSRKEDPAAMSQQSSISQPSTHSDEVAEETQSAESIAVLPILNDSHDAQADYLCDGVPRTLIRSLLEIPDLNVRPFSSVQHYAKHQLLDPRDVGIQLEVDAVLVSTISQGKNDLQMHIELMDVRRNRSLWIQSYDLKENLLFVQDDILKEVAAKLGCQLTDMQRQRLNSRPTQDTAAYLEYLEGIHAVHQWTVRDTKRGIDRLERALARDPEFTLAQAALTDAYIAAAYIFMEPRVALEKARKIANETLTRNASIADAHAAIATVMFHVDWDWSGADREFQRALELNPRCTFAHDYYGWYWNARGQPERAIAELETAVQIEPRSMLYNADLAFVYQHGRRFDEAESQALKTLELDSNNAMAPWTLSMVYSHRDQNFTSAIQQAQIFLERDRDRPDGYGMLGYVYGMAGEREKAMSMLTELDGLAAESYVRGETRAWIYAGLGDKDQAFRCLDQVCDEKSPGIIYFKLDPLLDSLRDDPRFLELLQRVGLAE